MPLAQPWQPTGAPPPAGQGHTAAGAPGSAHGCHLPFVKHPEREANSSALLNPNTHSNALNTNQPHAWRVHPNHLPAPQSWPTVTSRAGTALLFCHLLQPPVSHSSRSKAELQDARYSCGNHPRRDGILPPVSGSVLEAVSASTELLRDGETHRVSPAPVGNLSPQNGCGISHS